jgi:hypothetical protein
LIVKEFGWTHVSAGDLLRAEVQKGTEWVSCALSAKPAKTAFCLPSVLLADSCVQLLVYNIRYRCKEAAQRLNGWLAVALVH